VIEIFILSLIQGVTEFLPISSSSHLILVSEYFAFENKGLSIDVSLHIGSFAAVLVYFKNDILDFYENKFLFFKILLASLPVMIVGYILAETGYIDKIRSIKIIAWTTIIFGLLLYISDRFKLEKNINKDFNFKSVLFIGILQILSLIPGVSRSGIAITTARLLNFKRVDAAKISFLLSIPILGAVSIFGVKNIIISESISFSGINLSAILISFCFSFITIKFFLKYIKKFNLSIFVIYRIMLGVILLVIAYL
tara:strand:+ start:12782 stop:13540 length:759 start_codon:yes stop_codon:yes gene_type:complete